MTFREYVDFGDCTYIFSLTLINAWSSETCLIIS